MRVRGACAMKSVLWLSRHLPTQEQITTLTSKIGAFRLVHRVPAFETNRESAALAIEALIAEVGADDIVCSISVQHLAELCGRGWRPIRAVMRRHPSNRVDGNGHTEYDYSFERFERVVSASYEVEDL